MASSSRSILPIRTALSFLFIFFLLISSNPALASTQACDYAASTATVRASPVTLNVGTKGTSSISSTNDYGSVTATAGFTFYENTSGASTTATTDFSIPTSSGSFTVAAGLSVYLYSPIFPSATTLYSGSWILDLWASATSSGAMSVSFVAVDSSNNTVATAASGNTGTIGITQSEVKTSFSGSQISVPLGGCLIANITNPTASGITFTIYWGSGQPTNYQTPADYDYILAINNSAASSYTVSLLTYSSSSINRLTNMTVSIYSPSTNEIIITNGAFTQSSGPTATLLPSSALYIRLFATANAFGSSNIVLLMKFASSTKPFAYDAINLTVN